MNFLKGSPMSFLGNLSPEWIEQLYLLWRSSPDAVPHDWQAFFSGYDLVTAPEAAAVAEGAAPLKQSAVQSLIYRYRDIGHLLACTDPLSPCKIEHPLLTLDAFELEPADLDRIFTCRRFHKNRATLREIVEVLRDTYCRSIGVEFMHIQEPGERQWLIDRMEPVRNRPNLSEREKLAILGHLREATRFEEYLSRKFIGQTRFSLEGGEVLIPLLTELFSRGARLGIGEIVMGMPHRGRLNVLVNALGVPLENIFVQFRDNLEHEVVGDGDVKYHIGCSVDLKQADGTLVHVTLAANPSHLEAINPVVEGKARARQERAGTQGKKQVLPLLIHGDAAFAGQGVVAETFNLSQLEGYGTGGTLHLVLNNQIGFTTAPADARSSCYATDVAKMVMAPVFHVHGEDPEAALQALRLALDYRQAFQRDVVVEVICYRRYGHNEGDEPYFTQPLMYRTIKERPPVGEIYAGRLAEEGLRPEALAAVTTEEYARRLEEAAGREGAVAAPGFLGEWSGIERGYAPFSGKTGTAAAKLLDLGGKLAEMPAGFTAHPKVAALLEKRLDALRTGQGIDWGNAETLAFATLLAEGSSVRLSGQDVRRGTFSQRHCTLFDVSTGAMHVPLEKVAGKGAQFHAYDSMLSENAVLGFEYGYSLTTPHDLTIWEAQYGDFANGAQVVIDQFIASGETKWDRVSGLTLFLPHGYEGQGPEHTSARIERYLQLCADANMQVAYPTTPAQFFHLLRRQVKEPFRKPLIVFTPKSLLRHPRCVSTLDEFTAGGFREIIPDAAGKSAGIGTVILCSGKIYYELLERREREKRDDVALIRIEQLYPLRLDLLGEALALYPATKEYRWVQEEPANMGAWSFLRPHLAALMGREPQHVGRREDASPAVGSHRVHKQEQERLLEKAFAKLP